MKMVIIEDRDKKDVKEVNYELQVTCPFCNTKHMTLEDYKCEGCGATIQLSYDWMMVGWKWKNGVEEESS